MDFENAQCPYCGALNEVAIEPTLKDQQWVEDCTVCCQPIRFQMGGDIDNLELTCDRA
ncbi:MAG: CPXCG motif-containing cysteine-rich protein [Candidatus Methylacidiphilales bacterium]